ncbi:MAG: hypothetical protein M3452_00885 [Chloroflexota bacterium]|nr:hypothetical protein [Chloroflexota bacterium]
MTGEGWLADGPGWLADGPGRLANDRLFVDLRGVLRTVVMVAATAVLVTLLVATLGTEVLAAEPQPSIVPPVDPRSDGQGPGLVGSPVGVAMGVILLGVVVAAVTALVLRLTREG